MATINSVTNGGEYHFDDTNAWSGGVVPGKGDVAVIQHTFTRINSGSGYHYWNGIKDRIIVDSVSNLGFEATSGDIAGWEMGAAEGFVQSSFNSLMKSNRYTRLLKSMYKGLGERVPIKALYYPQRITAGGMAETLAEYAGEYADALSDNGHNWEKNYDRVFGRTRDERLKKLGVTMVMTFGMSTAFTVATSNAIEGEIKAMMNQLL